MVGLALAPRTQLAEQPDEGHAPTRLHRRGPWPAVAARTLIAAVFTLAALFPLAWMMIAGFKAKTEVVRTPFQFFPEVWRWENYAQILQDPTFIRTIATTFGGAVVFTALSLVVNSMAAYVFARLQFAGKRAIWFLMILTMFIPSMAILVTSFIVVTQLHMLDTMLVLILPGVSSAAHIFFLRQYYLATPIALEEAALLDGAGRWAIFRRIFVPMSKSVFVVVGMGSFLGFWNSYVWPIMTITSPRLFQVQQYLATFRSERSTELGLLMAGSFLAALPVIVLFLIFQRQIIGGIKIAGLQ
jgi:multiple sugar transport system permease protein